ncbi:ATP-binding protein [Ideonella sp. A 288]|uniref:sensor histidine kinase n=1 Tax=Ideonella sp. A 288 TaxID=1962181 RepID=UPI000B4BD381|nr:ATP-binding protein [Ideonella sp. A 288]
MTKSTRWALLVAMVAVVGTSLVLVYLLSLSTAGQLLERHFVWLYWVNVAVAAMLLLTIGLAALRLVVRWRRGKFGSRLLAKLAGIFALVGVIPGVLIYTVSYQFVARSIDTWFDQQVAGALDAGLALGRGTLDAMAADLSAKARGSADRLAEQRTVVGPLALERVREQLAVRDVVLVGPSGQILAMAGGSASAMVPERPSPALLRQARAGRSASQLEGFDDEAKPGAKPHALVRALALIPNNDISLASAEDRFLMVVQPVPAPVVANALAVQGAYREYQQRAIARDGLRRMYIGTLTLAGVLAIFGAVLLAVMLGNQIVRPMILLADGVRQVAAGDLTARPVFASRDELGGLTRSFADMTEQLSDAREQVQRGVAQLEGARTRLQTILDSLTAGVIVFDRHGSIDTVNPGATRILRQPLSAYRGRKLDEVPGMAEFAQRIWQRSELHRTSPEAGERDHWQDAFELPLGGQASVNLLLRGAQLPGDARLLVFDDITEVVSAQRSVAWAEVARRLAHEIKNPLTPIQLSAERMEHKLEAKLEGTDQAMLKRSVATIVAQVQAMKQLVDEFRDYARLPAARLEPLDLNTLVQDVMALYAAAHEQGRIELRLQAALPAIEGDASQLRQVVHNLVQNGLDAVADRPDGLVRVATESARSETGELRAVRLKVSDNGPGFSDKVLKRAFEPYITTKTKGTGLGLAVVKKIAEEHGARVRIANLQADAATESPVTGAQVSLSFSRFAAAAPSGPAPGPQGEPAAQRT